MDFSLSSIFLVFVKEQIVNSCEELDSHLETSVLKGRVATPVLQSSLIRPPR